MDSELKEHIKQGDIVEMIGNLSVDINNMPKPRLGTVINRNNAYVLVKPEGKDYMIDFLITEVEYHSAGNINLDRTPSPSGGIKTAEEIAKEIFYLPATNGQAEASIAKGAELIRQYGNQFAGDGVTKDQVIRLLTNSLHDEPVGLSQNSWNFGIKRLIKNINALPPQNTKES